MKRMKSRSKCAKRGVSSPTDEGFFTNLWHNLLQDALDTGTLYSLTLQTVLNLGGGGNKEKKEEERKKGTPVQSSIAEDPLQNLLSHRSKWSCCISHVARDSALCPVLQDFLNECCWWIYLLLLPPWLSVLISSTVLCFLLSCTLGYLCILCSVFFQTPWLTKLTYFCNC